MPYEGRTGVVIPVPAADGLLAPVEARYPGTVRKGVPAHVSVLYPFVAAAELDERVTATLAELFAEQTPMAVEFGECRRQEGFVYLRPDPIAELEGLMTKTRHRWPDIVPYMGVYGHVEPHVTVAMRTSEETAAAVVQEVTTKLPISAELREAWLVVFDGLWTLRGRFEFGR